MSTRKYIWRIPSVCVAHEPYVRIRTKFLFLRMLKKSFCLAGCKRMRDRAWNIYNLTLTYPYSVRQCFPACEWYFSYANTIRNTTIVWRALNEITWFYIRLYNRNFWHAAASKMSIICVGSLYMRWGRASETFSCFWDACLPGFIHTVHSKTDWKCEIGSIAGI
jgi:hypothetical protein